jgi:hypothetical protein
MKQKFTVLSGVLLIVTMGMGTLGCQQTSNNSTGHAGAPAGSRSGRPAKVSWSGTRRVEITDPKYQMIAATLDVPTGWKFAGAVARPPGCHDDGVASIEYTLLSPDGVTAIAALPRETWNWSTSPRMQQSMAKSGCPGVNITSAAGFLINIAVPNMRPNAKIIGVFPLPAEIQSQLTTEQANLRQQYPRQQYVVEGARVRIQYLRNGQPVEEMITAAINCSSGTWPPMWPERSPSRHTDCGTQYLGVVRAPQGHLDQLLAEPQLAAVIVSAHEKDDWFHRMVADKVAAGREALDAFNQRSAQILAQGQADHDQLMAKAAAGRESIEEQGANSRAQAQNEQNARDQAARQTENYSLDRQDFINPATGETINASSEYNHQWLSSDGSTLIQTDDNGLDPNGQVYPVSQSWNELVPKQ